MNYNPETGIFTRITSTCNVKSGDIAGSNSGLGYIRITIDYSRYFAHRLAFLYIDGHFPVDQVDHINGVTGDNRWANLRHVTHQENQKNRAKNKNNTSDVTGVHWYKRIDKWQAKININGKKKHIGYYSDKQDAINARKKAEIKYNYHENHGRNK